MGIKNIEKTIQDIRSVYRTIETKIKASGVKHVRIDVEDIIKNICRKNHVDISKIKKITGWSGSDSRSTILQ